MGFVSYKYENDVYGWRFWPKFLRCFGDQISSLIVDCALRDIEIAHQCINQYCAGTLTKLKFRNKQTFSNDIFQRPFEKVEILHLDGVNLENNLTNFANWFPILRHLELSKESLADATDVFFPHLEHLTLEIWQNNNQETGKYMTREKAMKLFHASPQLQSLKIVTLGFETQLTLSEILYMIRKNAFILKLVVNGSEHKQTVVIGTNWINL